MAHTALGIVGVILLISGLALTILPSIAAVLSDLPRLFAPRAPASSLEDTSSRTSVDASDSPSTFLSFADLHLGQAIQSVIDMPLGEIRAIDLQRLQILDASHRGVIELGGIAQCPNLLDLNLSHNEIVNVSLLATLTKLECLDLSDNHIRGGAGIEGIAACENLGTLDLSGNELVDISLLAGLEFLTELNLSRNEIADASPLLANPGLGSGDRVDLRLNPLDMGDSSETRAVIEALEDRGVTVIPSGRDNIVVFVEARIEAAVRDAVTQREGHLIAGTLEDVAELMVPDCGITDLEGIQYLDKLQRIDLSMNEIVDCSRLKDLEHVKELNVDGNRIENVAPIVGMGSLMSLRLASNKIASIDVDWKARGLVVLDLRGNEIDDIGALGDLTGLRLLDLSNNRILDIAALRGFQVLRNLALTGNQVSDISALSGLSSLWNVELAGNEIVDISPLLDCISLRSGAYVDLRGNPLDTSADSETMSQIDRLIGRGVIVDY